MDRIVALVMYEEANVEISKIISVPRKSNVILHQIKFPRITWDAEKGLFLKINIKNMAAILEDFDYQTPAQCADIVFLVYNKSAVFHRDAYSRKQLKAFRNIISSAFFYTKSCPVLMPGESVTPPLPQLQPGRMRINTLWIP